MKSIKSIKTLSYFEKAQAVINKLLLLHMYIHLYIL